MSEADGTTLLTQEQTGKPESSAANHQNAANYISPSVNTIPHTISASGIRCPRFPNSHQEASSWGVLAEKRLQTAHTEMSTLDIDFDIPFAALSRAERINRIADWTSPVDGLHGGSSYRKNFVRPTAPRANEEEEAGWSIAVDTRASTKERKGGSFTTGPNSSAGAGRFSGAPTRFNGGKMGGGAGGHRRGGWGPRFGDRPVQRKRDPSILVEPTWKMLEEIEFSRLSKLQLDPDDAIAVETAGKARIYDPLNDKINARSEKALSIAASDPIRYADIPAIDDDSLMLKIATEHNAVVLAPDYVASILMAAIRAVNPWDIVIKRKGSLLILDKRPGSAIDLLSVNETSPDAPPDGTSEGINTATALSFEATRINLQLPQALSKPHLPPIHFNSHLDATGSSRDYCMRYSKMDLGDGVIALVRSISSAFSDNTSESPVSFATLLEYEHKGVAGMDWRVRLDSQLGAVFAKEIRNNGSLLARAVFQALLSAIGTIKIAYVSRVSPKDATRHGILGLHNYDPYELAQQMNLNVPNGFGILRALVDFCRNLSEGEFALVRDPNKPLLRVYETKANPVNELEETIDELVSAGPEFTIDLNSEAESE